MPRSDTETSIPTFARMRQLALIGTGCTIIALGVLISPLPGPGGLPVMLLGGVLVLRNSADARRLFVRMKRRYPRVLGPVERFRVKLRVRRQKKRMQG
ncbi:hypothetical protein J2847_004316 [Azospirillum agricola]|uniref:hypothetical protein n=1 Tax=Azospirillum agricola TaxID=1720247 RepID=UPI001AE758D6|nr:hypothetical protein [Azospirillum agricola]MBP2231005.1 hypothetical protein [Azospirillum agricola]